MNRWTKIAGPILCAAAGCANPELLVVVDTPPALASLVEQSVLHVYIPPAGAEFDCLDLELGRVSAEARAFSESQVVRSADAVEAPIRAVDRLAHNVLYVELLDENEQPIAFACSDLEPFAEDVTAELTAEPATRLTLPSSLDLSRFAGEVLQPRIPVEVLDVLDHPVAGALISWTVASATGANDSSPNTSDVTGHAEINPDLPITVGPFVVVRASWLTGGPVELRGLVAPEPKVGSLPGLPLGVEVGRFREGKDSVAVLFGFGADRRIELYDASSFRANGTTVVAAESIPVGEGAFLGKLDYPGEELDRLVTLSTPGSTVVYTRFDPDGHSVEKITARPQGATTIRRIFNSGACRAPGRPMLTVIFDGEVVGQYDEQGNLLAQRQATAGEVDYLSSGCIGDESGNSRRVLAKRSPFSTTILEILGGTTPQVASWLDQPGFVSFTPPIGGPELFLANTLQSSARTIVQGRLALEGEGAPRIEVLASDPVSEVPLVTAGLDIDGDDRLDYATILTGEDAKTGVRPYRLRVSIPDEYSGRRISGSIGVAEDLCYATILTGDFDGDQSDDVLVSELTPLGCGSLANSRVYFYSMGPGRR